MCAFHLKLLYVRLRVRPHPALDGGAAAELRVVDEWLRECNAIHSGALHVDVLDGRIVGYNGDLALRPVDAYLIN
jgi:hypothetical protein